MSTNDHEEDDEKITLSEAQLKVIDRIMKRKSTFFTGAAGTGKSYIVAIVIKILKHLELMNKIALTAPTGVAACNISGMTIHSWAGVGLGTDDVQTLYNKLRGRGYVNEDVIKRWKETEILVIDEVSMLSAELFEKISTLGSLVRKDKRPFGGLQVILCGDFFQLPPVNRGESFCFQSPVWEELLGSDGKIVLDKVFRQKDGPFVRILNDMRRGLVSHECNSILTQKMHETTRLLSAPQVASSSIGHESIKHTCLFSRNEDCDRLNDFELRKLPPFKQPISLNNPYNAPLEEDRGLVFEGRCPYKNHRVLFAAAMFFNDS